MTEEEIAQNTKWQLEDIQQIAAEMRSNNPISEIEEKIKTDLFKNFKEERLIALE